MFPNRESGFNEYNLLNIRLKKKRILKKPNTNEASEQFESLAVRSESRGQLQVAGLCFRSAARYAASLGYTKSEAILLMKSARAFISAEIALVNARYITTEENLQEGIASFSEAYDRMCSEDVVITASMAYEIAMKLGTTLKKTDTAIGLLQRASTLMCDYPLEKVACLRQKLLLQISNELYEDGLKTCSEALDAIEHLPSNKNISDFRLDFVTHRVLLLMIVRPPNSQLTKKEGSLLEKLTWVDQSDGDEITDLTANLCTMGLSFFSADLFILLQSLVLAIQSCDTENLASIEDSLQPHVNSSHSSLLRTLVGKLQSCDR